MIPIVVGFLLLFAALLGVAQTSGAADALHGHAVSGILSFALLLAPYWFLGFGLDRILRARLNAPWKRLGAVGSTIVPYLLFTVPRGAFSSVMFFALLGTILAFAAVLEHGRNNPPPDWHDWIALMLLAFAVEFPFFRNAWPAPGLSGMSKLLFVDAGLLGFLVVRPIEGVGFDLRPRLTDFTVGLREFLYYTPIALALGLALGFLHIHRAGFPAMPFAAGWIFTLFFIALPEEIFFRGLMLNLLERRIGTSRALIATAIVFGLAHFPKRAVFNWRYVILAAIAGIFYGRAWLARRRILTSGVTHATVDTVWSIWLR